MNMLLYTLSIFCISFQLQSQEAEKLPAQPWVEIIQMDAFNQNNFPEELQRGGLKMKAYEKVNIKLLGNYTKRDSINVSNAIRKLDLLTETVKIKFSSLEEANFNIHFLDSVKRNMKGHMIGGRTIFDPKKNTRVCVINIYDSADNEKSNSRYKPSVESRIARELVNGCFENKDNHENRYSIFSIGKQGKYFMSILNLEDQEIIHEIYKDGFEEKLKLAKVQYKNIDLEDIKNTYNKVINRSKKLWWVRNPIAVLFLPALLMFLIFLFFTSKINNYLSGKLKNNLLKFLLVSIVAVCFLDILIIFTVSFFDHLRTPRSFGFSIIRYDTVMSTLLVSLFCFPLLFLFRFLEFKIEKINANTITKTSLIFLSTGMLPFVIILLIVFSVGVEKDNLNEAYHTLSNMFLVLMLIASVRTFISFFIFSERKLIIENENKLSHLRELNAKAELKSLQSQINPHFLYNSLNSIASLAPIDAVKTQKMAHCLSDLFKYSINRKGKKMSTVKDEIEMVQAYLEIEKIRFGERLEFTIQADKTILNHEIPLFLIQPLVENAVKHGISQNESKGKIVLNIEKEANELIISVSDNGPNFPEGLVSGHGLQTVYDLLRLSYSDNASINWTNTPKKMISITILERA